MKVSEFRASGRRCSGLTSDCSDSCHNYSEMSDREGEVSGQDTNAEQAQVIQVVLPIRREPGEGDGEYWDRAADAEVFKINTCAEQYPQHDESDGSEENTDTEGSETDGEQEEEEEAAVKNEVVSEEADETSSAEDVLDETVDS